MPLFGAHLSTAGGICNAIHTAQELECETLQLFTKNNNQWSGKAIPPDMADEFKQLVKANKLKFVTAHDSYLINLASPDETLWQKSVTAFVDELHRAEQLNLSYLVMHPGSHVGSGEDAGLKRVITAFETIHEQTAGYRVKTLVELTAGQGSALGHRFEHIATILDGVTDAKRLGVCFDTCHVLAAGYPLSTEAEYQQTMEEFDHVIGLKQLKLFHLNDSKKPRGSRVDRHEHLGQGYVGAEAFRLIVNDPRFAKLPMILETPKTNAADEEMDPVNLGLLRQFRDQH